MQALRMAKIRAISGRADTTIAALLACRGLSWPTTRARAISVHFQGRGIELLLERLVIIIFLYRISSFSSIQVQIGHLKLEQSDREELLIRTSQPEMVIVGGAELDQYLATDQPRAA